LLKLSNKLDLSDIREKYALPSSVHKTFANTGDPEAEKDVAACSKEIASPRPSSPALQKISKIIIKSINPWNATCRKAETKHSMTNFQNKEKIIREIIKFS
jgi:hypothetical protein